MILAKGTTLQSAIRLNAQRRKEGVWVPACGGTERPFVARGYRLQYLWQPSTGRHAYINCDTDVLLTDGEVREIFLR